MSKTFGRQAVAVTAWLAASLASAVPAADPPPPSGGYVGAETCAACHDSQAEALLQTIHGQTSTANWEGATACESCHGPGAAHAEDGDPAKIRVFARLAPAQQSEVCMSCHDRDEHTSWHGSPHESRGLSCLSCHKIHHDGAPTPGLLSHANEFDTCRTCHLKRKVGALMRSSHMPLREGQMTCSSCHDPHGAMGPALLRQDSVNENCYSCHAEKRAPMLWEHPPVKESCLNCHDPHGSLHPRMQIAKQPRLCQQCHDETRHPTQPYSDAAPGEEFFPNLRMFDRGCMNCHSQIHGSNHPAGSRLTR